GTRLVFSSIRAGPLNLFVQAADASGKPDRLSDSMNAQWTGSWSPDGRLLAIMERTPKTSLDISVMSAEGEHEIRPLLSMPSNELGGRISPDGQWLAYISD